MTQRPNHLRMNPRAFTLLEMLVATALATVLMAAVLSVLTAVSRDRRRLIHMDAASVPPTFANCLRWDLFNAETMTTSTDGRSLILNGHGSIDPVTLRPTGRLVRVTYRPAEESKAFHLVREQEFLDDPVRPNQWRELVGSGISGVWVIPEGMRGDTPLIASADMGAGETTTATLPVPGRVRLHIETVSDSIDEDLWIK